MISSRFMFVTVSILYFFRTSMSFDQVFVRCDPRFSMYFMSLFPLSFLVYSHSIFPPHWMLTSLLFPTSTRVRATFHSAADGTVSHGTGATMTICMGTLLILSFGRVRCTIPEDADARPLFAYKAELGIRILTRLCTCWVGRDSSRIEIAMFVLHSECGTAQLPLPLRYLGIHPRIRHCSNVNDHLLTRSLHHCIE